MKNFVKKLVRSKAFWLGLVILVQTTVYLLAGAAKAYIHMDEAYSLGLAQYNQVELTDNEDFYNTWHTSEYYQDYLAVQAEERGDWSAVYENQKNDVHPPLYYLLLRGVMALGPEEFSKWPGILLNVAIMAGCTVLMFLIACRLFDSREKGWQKALAGAGLAGLTMASVGTVVYIRMYALLELMVLLTLWLHLKLREEKGRVWYGLIAGVALLGVLTQYYYLFFLAGLVIWTMVDYVRRKEWKALGWYLGSLAGAGILTLVVWPHILQHMFFGYRGQGAISNFLNPAVLFSQLAGYFWIVNYDVFHQLLVVVAVLMVGLAIWWKLKRVAKVRVAKEFLTVLVPTLSYFVFAAVASPYLELRYIMPVCGLIFVLVAYGLDRLMTGVVAEKWRDGLVLGAMGVVVAAAPVQIGLGEMRVQLLYRDWQRVMTMAEERAEAPLLSFVAAKNNRFLDDILLFAEVETSYISLDLLEPTTTEVTQILQGQNLEQGLFVLIGEAHEHERVLEAVAEATGLTENYVQRLNACTLYYFE